MPLLVHADDPLPPVPGPLLITEIQTGSSLSASEEFIELYNAATQTIDFAAGHWQVQVADAAATSWAAPHRTIALTGTLAPGAYYVLASKVATGGQEVPYLPGSANAWFSAGIAATAGHIRVLQTVNQTAADGNCAAQQIVSDEVEWSEPGTGVPLHASLDARVLFNTETSGIAPGKSLLRVSDTNNDTVDFVLGDPTPGTGSVTVLPVTSAVWQDTCVPAPAKPVPNDDPAPAIPAADIGLTAPQISELLPNPAAPLTDAADEFIELYNPNNIAFDLSGFTLQTGGTAKHSYIFPEGASLPPVGFVAFYARDTELVLSNAASQAALLDPLGAVVVQSDAYAKAPPGKSWLLADGSWQWSDVPTPGEANRLAVPIQPEPVATATATPKKAAAKAAAPAVKAAKTTKAAAKPKTAKPAAKPAAKVANVQSAGMSEPPPKGSMHIGVLAVVAGIAVVYGAYEYRHELSNKFFQLRANRGLGRKDGPGT